MGIIYRWFKTRPLRFLGGFIVFFSLALIIFLFLLETLGGNQNPYLGAVTYLILPGVLMFGLVLVPIDAWLWKRKSSKGHVLDSVKLDMSVPQVARIVKFFGVATVLVLISMTVAAYRGVEYMDTTQFCGQVCHKVMMPEFSAYRHSSHSSVPCVTCHIGAGAKFLVKAKISGLRQVWHYARGDYHRPIVTPVEDLRPSRDTCEQCHSPTKFYGSYLKTFVTHDQDEANTKQETKLEFKVGSGGVQGSGIHSHMVSDIEYLQANRARNEIASVSVTRPDGSKQLYTNPAYKDKVATLRAQFPTRRMDCIDCHNRTAHDFKSYEIMIDEAMTEQRVDSHIPFIKREAMAAVPNQEKLPTEAEQKQYLANIDAIPSKYRKEMPDAYKRFGPAIEASARELHRIYKSTVDAHMMVGPTTYPSWKAHDGCFRCHGTLVPEGAKDDQPLSQDCGYCHSDPSK